jgi:serine/threonine protein kinase
VLLSSNKNNDFSQVDGEQSNSLSASKKKPEIPVIPLNYFPFNHLLSDFGMAVKINTNGLPRQVSVGDQAFMPLESYDFGRLKSNNLELQKIDIFSLGLVLFSMMFGKPVPLTGQEWAEHRDPTIQRQSLGPLAYSERLKELVLLCLRENPSERPSAEQLISMSCLIRRESDAAEQLTIRRQAATLNRRIKELQSAVQSPTTSSQKTPFSTSKIFLDADDTNQHERSESQTITISSDSEKGHTEAANHF